MPETQYQLCLKLLKNLLEDADGNEDERMFRLLIPIIKGANWSVATDTKIEDCSNFCKEILEDEGWMNET